MIYKHNILNIFKKFDRNIILTFSNNNSDKEVAIFIVDVKDAKYNISIYIVTKETAYKLANKIINFEGKYGKISGIYIYDPEIDLKTLFPIQWYFVDYKPELQDMDQFDRQSVIEGNKDLP